MLKPSLLAGFRLLASSFQLQALSEGKPPCFSKNIQRPRNPEFSIFGSQYTQLIARTRAKNWAFLFAKIRAWDMDEANQCLRSQGQLSGWRSRSRSPPRVRRGHRGLSFPLNELGCAGTGNLLWHAKQWSEQAGRTRVQAGQT